MNSSNDAWLDAVTRAAERGQPAVLVTVVAALGSAPRAAGAKMAVSRSEVAGTIGGGHLELQAIGIARDMLAGTTAGSLRRFPLGAALGQCCGGAVDLLFEPVAADDRWPQRVRELRAAGCVVVCAAAARAAAGRLVVSAGDVFGSLGDARLDAAAIAAARDLLDQREATVRKLAGADPQPIALLFDPVRLPDFNLVLFGAGHVGRALVRALTDVPCRITWVDERAQEFPAELPPNARAVVTDAPDEEVDAAPRGSFFLVMTHSHALDQQLSERILRRDDFTYFGLIGSKTKRRLFERRMAARGVPEERFARMTCPIGVRGIAGKEPAVIALAAAAELLQVREAQAVAGANRRSA